MRLENKLKEEEKKNLTLTNDNCCITILWGSLCRQQGSWDRWRPIWANPQLKGAINQSLGVFMGMGCDVSISLSVIGKTISKLTKVTNHKHRTQRVWGKVGWLESVRPKRLCNLCRPQPSCTFTLVLKNVLNLSSIAFWLSHLERTAPLGTHTLLQSNMSASVGNWRYLFKFCASLPGGFGGLAVLSSWLIKV